MSNSGLRRAGQQSQRRRIQNREQMRKLRESALFKIKETELFVPPVPKTSSFLYQCCQTCTPTSRVSLNVYVYIFFICIYCLTPKYLGRLAKNIHLFKSVSPSVYTSLFLDSTHTPQLSLLLRNCTRVAYK